METYWEFIEYAPSDKNGNKKAVYRCVCGKMKVMYVYAFKIKRINHCGCLRPSKIKVPKRKPKAIQPPKTKVRDRHNCGVKSEYKKEYYSWVGIRARCNNPKNREYKHYGGRGIRVCERWDHFINFLQDMGKAPSPQHSLDRKENDGNYEPSNCRWATMPEQSRNRRTNRWFDYNGERLILKDLAAKLNRNPNSLWKLLKKYTLEQIANKTYLNQARRIDK